MTILYILIGILIGVALGFMAATNGKQKMTVEIKQAESEKNMLAQLKDKDIAQAQQKADEYKNELEKQKNEFSTKIGTLEDTNRRLLTDKTAAESEIKNLREKLQSQMQEMEQRHEQMMKEFENLSNKVLRDHSDDFSRLGQDAIRKIVDPFAKDLEDFHKKVDNYYSDETKQRSSLEGVIKTLSEQNQKISEDASNLANALRGETKIQGNWGEDILNTILENSGLIMGEQYFPQETIADVNGNKIIGEMGKKMIPDMIVKLPHDQKLIIDSKVSLTAYIDYVNTEDKEIQKARLKDHVASVKKHIDELSTKDYSRYIDNAPDFVMMFIPHENAYYAAIQAEPNLWNYAYGKGVILMNSTNLITAIKLASDLWARDSREKNYTKVVEMATKMYDKFVGFTEELTNIGDQLNKAKSSYDTAMRRFTLGNGSVTGWVEKLKNMNIVTSNKQLKIKSEQKELEDTKGDV